MDEDWPLGEAITTARERAGLSKNAAARRAGISESYWRILERGWANRDGVREKPAPTVEVLAKVAGALNVPTSSLADLAGLTADTPDAEDQRTQAADLISRLPARALPEAVAFLRGLNAGSRT